MAVRYRSLVGTAVLMEGGGGTEGDGGAVPIICRYGRPTVRSRTDFLDNKDDASSWYPVEP
ncbi:hypothetical protein [Eastern grey kangaroopox virus]|uniref:Uncharacterized protein n=1 Tax=Eastern grey kangaroopox virus TaxID=2042482 RepID=A0A2C9DTC4_9POXV|nr:hypothetical protein KM541_gp161 [Eastern grey kangaroopox virus]ATI21257.1 hypothetical protein [Eastern grey kangaroopox virus]AXK50193.1 hypothetical protein EKPV-NSW-ORF181 [Eastern grey kangaroopox virus]